MYQIFGDFKEDLLTTEQEFLQIGFSPSSVPLQQRWRNNGLSADFVADYLTTFFSGGDNPHAHNPNARRRQAEIKSAVSFIANELLENAMKFNDENSKYSINFGLHLLGDTIVLYVMNSVSPEQLDKFQTFIEEFVATDPEELYIRQLEKNAESDENNSGSGLGLLTMKNDYSAKLGWKVETVRQEPEVHAVTTMVQLTV